MSDNESTSASKYDHWRHHVDEQNIAWLCIDKADGKVNVLSGPVLRELDDLLLSIAGTAPDGLVLYSGKDSGFVMGADINEFTRIGNADEGFELARLAQKALDRLEELACPTVAVINGFALGGGLELAMACKYRIAIDNPKPIIGLPEVQLGIHPGFGGTVRTVRIAGVRAAMELMLTGKSITVSRARRIGLVDSVCDDSDWKSVASNTLKSTRPGARAPFIDRLMNLSVARPFVSNMLRKQVSRKAL